MKALVHYEMKKIWKRKSTGVVFLLMLLSIIAISLIFVSDQGYYGKDGAELRGFEAISEKRSVERASVDPLDSQRLQIILQNYKAAYADQANYDGTTGFLRNDVYVENVLPYREILNLIRGVYTPDVYDLSALAALSDEQTGDFYSTRQSNIQGILASGNYTAAEKEKVMELDSQITTPFEFDYSNGWKTLLARAFSFLFMLIALATCIMISPIFFLRVSNRYRRHTVAHKIWQIRYRPRKACRRLVHDKYCLSGIGPVRYRHYYCNLWRAGLELQFSDFSLKFLL